MIKQEVEMLQVELFKKDYNQRQEIIESLIRLENDLKYNQEKLKEILPDTEVSIIQLHKTSRGLQEFKFYNDTINDYIIDALKSYYVDRISEIKSSIKHLESKIKMYDLKPINSKNRKFI